MKEVLLQEGMDDFRPSSDFKAAVEIYKKLCETPEGLLLQSTYNFINKSREILDELDYGSIPGAKGKIEIMKAGMGIVSLIPKLMKDLAAAKAAVEKEQEEQGKARGSQEMTVFDLDDD